MLDANNYAKLVNSGRAKAIGTPWSEAEWAEIQTVQGAEREALIAKFRGVAPAGTPSVETPKVEEPKVETPEVPAEPVAKPKKVKKVKK